MDKHTLELIEFAAITAELSSYCFTEEVSETVGGEKFFYDKETLSGYLDMVDEFELLLTEKGETLPVYCPETGKITEKLGKEGAVLDEAELSSLRQQLVSGRVVKGFITGSDGAPSASTLHQLAAELPGLRDLEKMINAVITPEGEVDETLPSLQSIRKGITNLNAEIRSIAVSYLQNPAHRNYIQDQVPGQKDGRTVLPIKARHKQKINGLVQDISASGATIFIEPYELVEKNNQLAIEKGKYRQEIHRILQDLTKKVREYAREIGETREILLRTDSIYCRARYSSIHRCARADSGGDEIDVRGARHPLLGESAVPVRISFGPSVRVLVISGPNTGGKTVALKTAALLSVMHQFGMKLPVEDGSRLPVFSNVFTDIGDEQSIDLSLSTFSGHMRRISGICREVDERSFVLLDELGSGTDAVEGGALAMAVLDYLSAAGCRSIVTTHQSSLKNYAFGKETAENASVEFDLALLRPTFRLLHGVPGESHALEIAEMTGMGPSIMNAARKYLEQGESNINTIIKEITKTRQELLKREEAIEEAEEGCRNKEANLREREAALRRRQEELRRGDVRELQKFAAETRKRLENMVRELREGEITKSKTKRAKQFLHDLTEQLEEKTAETEGAAERGAPPEEAVPFREGMEVVFSENRNRGVLLRKNKEKRWVVAVGNMKIEADETELRPLKPEKERPVAVDYSAEKVQIPMELDIRGMRYEEAQGELRKYLDNAVLQGMERLEIIHGKGEGVLQDAVRKVLRELPVVEDFSFAPPEIGGFGKTIVVLKKAIETFPRNR
jgi:DNA mismatch repair protein MutS2